MLLHKTVGVKLARIDESGNLVGRVHFPAGDIACEALKNGLARLSTPKDMNFDSEYYGELKKAQLVGQGKRLGIWKNFKADETKQDSFTGKVVEVHSGDSLTVEKD